MRKPSPATIIATVALFVALGGAAVAATGSSFILGQPNSAASTSSLAASVVGGKVLQLSNTSSTTGSTALGLNVTSGHAPFTVNTGIKVANLNADTVDGRDSTYFLPKTGKASDSDKLDGIDSTGLIQGSGRSGEGALKVVAASNNTQYALLTIPGLGGLSATCRLTSGTSGPIPEGLLDVTNGTAGSIYVSFNDIHVSNQGYFPYGKAQTISGNDEVDTIVDDYGFASVTGMMQLNPSTGDPPVATVFYSVMFDGSNCVFRASYLKNG